MSYFFTSSSRLSSPFSNNKTYLHPIRNSSAPPPTQAQVLSNFFFKKQIPISVVVPSTSMNRSLPSLGRSDPTPFIASMNPSTAFSLTAAGLLTPRIKIQSDNKKEAYTFQSKSDSTNRNMTVKDYKNVQVCKVKNKGEHLLDLYLTTDEKDINVQFRDMIAFKKAVEKNGGGNGKVPLIYQPGDEDDDRIDGRYPNTDPTHHSHPVNVCWAFEFEGRIYQWTAAGGHGIHAQPGADVLVCHTTSTTPPSRIARLHSSHVGASDKLIIFNAPTANVLDKNGLQILLLTSVLSLMEIMNDRSRDLLDFD